MRSLRTTLHALLMTLAMLVSPQPRAADVERAPLEAAIVYNILMYVQWPEEGSANAQDTLTLCVDTASPAYAASKQLEGRPVRRMKVAVQPVDAAVARCHALYVDTPAAQRAAASLGPKDTVLVVAGSRQALTGSPTVQLLEAEGRLGFDISQRRAQTAGLVVSSRLLRLARRLVE